MSRFSQRQWAVVLGGSSGFGLATAKKLSAEGMSVCIVHRDRRGAMDRINREFDAIRAHGHPFVSVNTDALSPDGMATIIETLTASVQPAGGVRVLMHSIAYGNLKPIVAAARPSNEAQPLDRLAGALGLPRAQVDQAVQRLSDTGEPIFQLLNPVAYGDALIDDEDMARTIYSMGTSLLTWVQRLHAAGLFAASARVIGLTSEGNEVAWRGYAAVAAAKSVLESVSRAIAVEFGPHGIRSNILQPGVTDTPALRVIPGSERMKAGALLRNPLGRLTAPEDVANAVFLLSLDEADWINGALIRVDGGSTLHRGDTTLGDLFIHGVGHFHPENQIDNAFLTSLDIGTDDAWIMERVGIRSRRTVLPLEYITTTRNAQPLLAAAASLYTNAETGAKAARLALARAGLAPSDIGLVIAGGCSPQNSIPAEACQIAAELGIHATAYDINSACSSFAVQLHHLQQMRPNALPDYVLVVNVENTTRTVDYRDRRTAVLWGDGSAAAVVSTRVPAPVRVKHSVVHSDPTGWNKVVIPAGGHFVQDGQAVQGYAIRKSVATIASLAAHLERDRSDLVFIGHQANLMMLNTVCERAEISPARHLRNVEDFGNCGAAGAPSVLSQRWDDLPPACEIALVVVGSGLTWAGLLIDVRRPS